MGADGVCRSNVTGCVRNVKELRGVGGEGESEIEMVKGGKNLGS